MITCNAYPAELKVFLNHVYEYKKGVRNMVLYTTNKKYEEFMGRKEEKPVEEPKKNNVNVDDLIKKIDARGKWLS